MTTITTYLDDMTRTWGQATAPGILIDHAAEAVQMGATLHTTERWGWLTSGKGQARRVVCGDLVEWGDEDGLREGRCGYPVVVHEGRLGTGCGAHDLGPDWGKTCPHGLSLALCSGPGHYPADH
jgi:hypothetical protein